MQAQERDATRSHLRKARDRETETLQALREAQKQREDYERRMRSNTQELDLLRDTFDTNAGTPRSTADIKRRLQSLQRQRDHLQKEGEELDKKVERLEQEREKVWFLVLGSWFWFWVALCCCCTAM